jgi:hypothetical protein
MLTSILLSIVVLPGIIFLIVCLVGFRRAMVSERPTRAQIERLEVNRPGDKLSNFRGSRW